jgi:3'5'-cyclic nucleotide phosphodiesterase
MVDCKGKGKMVSYWVEPRGSGGSISQMSQSDQSCTDADLTESDPNGDIATDRNNRLIDWHVDVFLGLLKGVVSSRRIGEANQFAPISFGRPIDEVKEVVEWRAPTERHVAEDSQGAAISSVVTLQLRAFIKVIADLYQTNPFHNFQHCSHVVMSTKKLLDRIEKQKQGDSRSGGSSTSTFAPFDPLSTFAIVFAALIHDVDHRGVSNQTLVEEGSSLATMYNKKSVAEQNSIDVAFSVLWEPLFSELRCCLFSSKRDVIQFRQVVVNAVMATDLFDKDLKALRAARWDASFSAEKQRGHIFKNRRSTIVLELILQASDVSHTMQHFTVYKKWSMNLLAEMHAAFVSGRSSKDPLDGWYDGELWFFDNYIIPLAQKLRECQVFGVSCDEFLDYAKDNRAEWEIKGREIVAEAKARLQAKKDGIQRFKL